MFRSLMLRFIFKSHRTWLVPAILVFSFLVTGCAVTLLPVSVRHSESLFNYKYFYIQPTGTVTSSASSGVVIGNMVFSEDSESVNPGDIIAGQLIKVGFIRVPELRDDIKDKTVIVNYGETGTRAVALGSTTEVNIQFLSAETLEPICTCTGEGFGDTKADDVKEAIYRCLQQAFIEMAKK